MERIKSAMQTPDGYWRVEVYTERPGKQWFRVIHGTTIVADKAAIATVHRILGDHLADLVHVDPAA